MGALFYRLVIVIVVGCFALLLIIAGTMAVVAFYPTLGRVADFQEVQGSVTLAGTDYALDVSDSEIMLTNTVNESQYDTGLTPYRDVALHYKLFNQDGNTYLLLGRAQTGGNGGGLFFAVYNITGEPYPLTDEQGFTSISSCTYPRLAGDALEFESDQHCDAYPLLPQEQQFYRVVLR